MFAVGGLSSGLDTESIVTQLLALERTPITQATSKQTALRRVDNAWGDIVSKLSAVRTALDGLKDPSSYGTHTSVTSSSDAVAVTRTGSPVAGGLSFTVSQLASTYQGTLSGATSLTSGSDLVGDGILRVKHADGAAYTEIDTTGKTLAQVATALQEHTDLQVNASVQQASDGTARLLVSSRRSGADGGLQFDLTTAPATLNTSSELFAGRDAVLTMGTGADALQISSPTNRITNLIDGVTIDLREATTSPVTVQVERDPAITVEKVRGLVDALNTVVSTLKTSTAYNADRGVAGTLQGERTAVNLRFDLSGALARGVSGLTGDYTNGNAIGLEVGRDGTITLDESKLSGALAKDFEGVLDLLTAPADGAAGAAGRGLLTDLDSLLSQYEGTTGRIANARQGLTDRISAYDDQIERYEVRVELRERMLRAKYAGLESALSNVQAQGSTLLSALGFAGR